MLCDNLVGWDGMRVGRKVPEEWDICIFVASSRCCMAEINTTL